MRYFFISRRSHDNKILKPRIPKNRMPSEDDKTPRICVSTSIAGCLAAVQGLKEGNTVYIHTCTSEAIIQPTNDQVPDIFFTGEVWITESVEMELIGKIKITKVDYFDYDPEKGISMTNYQYRVVNMKDKAKIFEGY